MDSIIDQALRVILLEDDPADAALIERELRRNGVAAHCWRAATASEFAQLLRTVTPDLLLADYTLPGFDGMTALQQVRQLHPDTPFIFVSGSLGEERAIEALKSGATDYVLKDRLTRLPAVVKRALSESLARQERRRAELALESQRNLLTALIDNLPEYIYAVDEHSRLTVINRALLQQLKRSRNECLGLRLVDLYGAEVGRQVELQDAMVLNSGHAIIEQEQLIEHADGTMQWLVSSRIPLLDHTGKAIGVVCTERDITNRKELEREILDISNREQRRLGNDLHDGLGQELTGLSLMMKGLEVQMSREGSEYLPQVARLSELIAMTIKSTRSLARGLAPVNLERGGIREALRQLAARCTDIYQLECVLDDSQAEIEALDEGIATHVYRIAQEATTNAARHAQARSIRIELRTTARRLYLSISDDGKGLPAGQASERLRRSARDELPVTKGMGLKIMEYRARTIGGNINFEGLKPGTRVALSCPLRLPKHMQRAAKGESVSHATRG